MLIIDTNNNVSAHIPMLKGKGVGICRYSLAAVRPRAVHCETAIPYKP
jgi:hypothetical protein